MGTSSWRLYCAMMFYGMDSEKGNPTNPKKPIDNKQVALRTVLRDATNNPGRDIPVCGDDDAVGWILMIVRLQLHLLLAAWDAYSWKLVIDV
jgi:hypothetical protein